MHRKRGDIWVLRYRVTKPDGSRMEKIEQVGLARDFPKERDARKEADRLGLLIRINDAPTDTRIRFEDLAEHYLKADFGENALRPKSENTIAVTEHIVRHYLVPRWRKQIADDIKPLDVQLWLKSLHDDDELAWTTISKMRGIMSRVYKVGLLHEKVTRNPLQHVETRSKTDYRPIVLTPAQTFAILKALTSLLHFALVLTCAATALRASEVLALRWADIEWQEKRIRVSKRWAKGKDGETKTEASDGYVPLHSLLADHLRAWYEATPHTGDADFVFPSLKCQGKVPLCASVFVADHLRPAAKKSRRCHRRHGTIRSA
jgi:integrase